MRVLLPVMSFDAQEALNETLGLWKIRWNAKFRDAER